MKILSDIKPVTYLKTKAAALLDQVNETHRPVVITQNGEPKARFVGCAKLCKYTQYAGDCKIAFPRGRRRCEKRKNPLTRTGL